MKNLSDYEGEFLNLDGAIDVAEALINQFGEEVVRVAKDPKNLSFYTSTGFRVSSNGYVSLRDTTKGWRG